MLVVVDGQRGSVWSGQFDREPARALDEEAEAAVRMSWVWSPLSFAGGAGSMAPIAGPPVVSSGGQLAFITRDSGTPGLAVASLSAAAPRVLAKVSPGQDFAMVPLDQVGRLALVWQESEGPAPSSTDPSVGVRRAASNFKTKVIELSASTGHVLFEGPARVGGPVSSQELKLLAIALVGVMIVVVAVILRPDAGSAGISLPRGYALAEPGRRVVAGVVDVLLATLVVSAVMRVSVLELLSIDVLARGSGGLGALLLIVGVGFAHTTLGDWLVGRSIGKVATGCLVVRPGVTRTDPGGEVTPVLSRPTLWRAAVRNLVCWLLPPVAMWGMGAADHRHRGDIASGLIVVVEYDEPETSD
jgi:hypothetical protein